ncbi:variable surface protein [Plasmodium gonderi]|uniref:Variable surface protein n=1 Tax=Plasmodium gonderi TaxID=77519 RepID=A0A1Y1JP91_PLAGO|nr:variable surface protein [Plasmodium gonderi]GAW84301.1 variable surface protein [Plasmodium gonderi]
MTNDIFKIVNEFSDFEKIMNNSKTKGNSPNDENFKEIKTKVFPGFNSKVEIICKNFDNYTNTIQTNSDTKVSYNSSCIYLYYWLYYFNNNNNERNIEPVKIIYDELNKADSTAHQTICPQSDYSTITDNDMLKLKDLHVMYTYLNNNSSHSPDKCSGGNECAELYMKYKVLCESNSYSNFCNELKNVREKYNELSTTKCSVHLTYKMLPLFQKYNIGVPIVITILVILLISITLFILNNFTPYNTCFKGRLTEKRNKWNNKDVDYNIFQSYKNVSSAIMKSRHHILYNKF